MGYWLLGEEQSKPRHRPRDVKYRVEYPIKKPPSYNCKNTRRRPAAAVDLYIDEDEKGKCREKSDEVDREEESPKPCPNLQTSPSALMLKRGYFISWALGLRTSPVGGLEIESQLNQRQHDSNAS